jgi:hypothetical protein
MINFRYHVVSLFAVLVALAVGLVMGAGLLSSGTGTAAAVQVVDLQAEAALLRERVEAGEATLEFADAYGGQTQPAEVADRLAERSVVVVTLPGADSETVAATRESLAAAGASLAGTVEIDASWTDAGSEAVLDSLAAQLVTSGASLPDTDGYERGAVVLAAAVLASGEDVGEDADVGTPAAYVESGLVQLSEPLRGSATLAVVVAGGPVEDDGEAGRRLGALRSLAAAFDSQGAGAVLAGPPAAAEVRGVIELVRSDDTLAGQLSTVDMAQVSLGRTSTVLALAEQESGGVGHYGGVGDVDGPRPLG